MKHRIYLEKYIRLNEYFFVRIKNKFFKSKRAIKIPIKDFDLFLSYKKIGKIKLYYICEASSGLRVSKYGKEKNKLIAKTIKDIRMRSLHGMTTQISKKNKVLLSPRYTRIVKISKDVAAD